MTAKYFRYLLIALLLLGSWATLERHPVPMPDEAIYASRAKDWQQNGTYGSVHSLAAPSGPGFEKGDAWHPRLLDVIFLFWSKHWGFGLKTARVTAFSQALLAVGVAGWVAWVWELDISLFVLLLVSHEMFLLMSHYHRPEITLLWAGLVFLGLLGYEQRRARACGAVYGALRGFWNFVMVAAHGNGLVFVLVNSGLVLISLSKRKKGAARLFLGYLMGCVLAILFFYALQIAPVGGLATALLQLKDATFDSYREPHFGGWLGSELVFWRWAVFPATSHWIGNALRFVSYGCLFLAPLLLYRRRMALLLYHRRMAPLLLYHRRTAPLLLYHRRMAPLWLVFLPLAVITGHLLLVHDKGSTQIAEMLPFFILPLALQFDGQTPHSRSSVLVLWLFVTCNLALVTHQMAVLPDLAQDSIFQQETRPLWNSLLSGQDLLDTQ